MKIKLGWYHENHSSYPIPYDPGRKIIVSEFLDYAIYLQREKNLKGSYVKNELFHLALFYNHCSDLSIDLYKVTDDTLRSFRDSDFLRLQQKSTSSKKSLQLVVNLRLRRFYHFYAWLQFYSKQSLLIGTKGCQIRSTLLLISPNNRKNTATTDYPLLFKRAGSSSKHATQYQATEKNIEALTDYFLGNFPPYIAQRNILILEIGRQTGFRRASINSLTCSQFLDSIIETAEEDYFLVRPPEQKFDYSLTYKIPLLLAFRINAFIKHFRAPLLCSSGFQERYTEDRIFLSFRSGRPLTHQSISEIFGDSFRSIGVHAGRVAIHSTRRTFANDEIKKEQIGRQRLRLDTSDASIASSVSLSLGQSDPHSIRSYVSRAQIEMIHEDQKQRHQELEELSNENIKLKEKIKALEKAAKLKPDV